MSSLTPKVIVAAAALGAGEVYDDTRDYQLPTEIVIEKETETKIEYITKEESHNGVDKFLWQDNSDIKQGMTNQELSDAWKAKDQESLKLEKELLEARVLNSKLALRLKEADSAVKGLEQRRAK